VLQGNQRHFLDLRQSNELRHALSRAFNWTNIWGNLCERMGSIPQKIRTCN